MTTLEILWGLRCPARTSSVWSCLSHGSVFQSYFYHCDSLYYLTWQLNDERLLLAPSLGTVTHEGPMEGKVGRGAQSLTGVTDEGASSRCGEPEDEESMGPRGFCKPQRPTLTSCFYHLDLAS